MDKQAASFGLPLNVKDFARGFRVISPHPSLSWEMPVSLRISCLSTDIKKLLVNNPRLHLHAAKLPRGWRARFRGISFRVRAMSSKIESMHGTNRKGI